MLTVTVPSPIPSCLVLIKMPNKAELEGQLLALQGKYDELKDRARSSSSELRGARNQLCEFEMAGISPMGPQVFPTFDGKGSFSRFVDDYNIYADS